MTSVNVLCEGFIRRENGVILEAHSSSTLVRSDSLNIVVDTSSVSNREKIIRSLTAAGLEPKDIDVVVNTHLHFDHCENNDLFTDALVIAHALESPGRGFKPIRGSKELADGVIIVHTPGHTEGSVSVLVESGVRYAVAGDAIPTVDNYVKWVPPGLNFDADLALASMKEIVDFADIVIPGHGPPFRVDRKV